MLKTRPVAQTILIVEDDVDTSLAVEQTLQHHGYRVAVALDADDALAQLDGGLDPDLIFSDVFMPGSMTGVAFVQEVLRRRPDAKVLMTSGFKADFHHKKEPSRIEHAFIEKPVDAMQLLARIRQMLAGDG